jgi:protoheme IX farnesyltransferase
VTHGVKFTCQHIVLYTIMMSAASLIPVSLGMNGGLYLVIVSLLDIGFLVLATALWRHYSDELARRTFKYSILYLFLLFAALFLDRMM